MEHNKVHEVLYYVMLYNAISYVGDLSETRIPFTLALTLVRHPI